MKISCMLSFSLLFAGAEAKTKESNAKRQLNRDFVAAMHGDPKLGAPRRKQRSKKEEKERKEELYKNLINSARKLDGQNGQYNYNNNGQNGQYNNNGNGNNNGQNNGQNGQYNYNGNGQNGQYYGQSDTQFYNQDGTYFGQGGMEQGTYWNGEFWQNQDGQYWNGQYFVDSDFDMTARAFKYSGCAAIKSFDEEKAEENGNPMVIDTYAVFRLCPAESCNKYSMTGCGKDYGEYAVEMKTYLGYILDYYQDRYDDYCDYCEPCDWEYQAEAKEAMQECYEDLNAQAYQESAAAQQDAWSTYYDSNNGDMSGYNNGGTYNGGDNFNAYNQYYNGASQAASGNNYNSAQNGGGTNYRNSGNQQYSDGNGNSGSYYSSNGGQAGGSSSTYNNGQYSSNNYNANNYNANGNRKMQNYYSYNNANNNANDAYDNSYWNQGDNGNGAGEGAGYWGADGIWYQSDDGGGGYYESQMVECYDGSMCDECEYESEQEYLWCDDYVCGDYYTYCSDLYGDLDQFDVFDYLECQEYENDNGDTYYIGPHCGSNHWKISLGVFSDENCAVYIGETVSLAKVIGYGVSDEDLFKIPKECISCDGTEDYEENQNQGEGRYGDYVSNPAIDDDGVVAICSALYESSAQCNQHMTNYNKMTLGMTQQEIDTETRYCSFIDNIVYGSYDEQGEILLKRETFEFSDWRNADQYRKLQMPAGQAIGLACSMLLVAALFAAAISTHRSLRRQSSPWSPKHGSMDPGALSRQNSGIVMGRSRSGPGSAPLI